MAPFSARNPYIIRSATSCCNTKAENGRKKAKESSESSSSSSTASDGDFDLEATASTASKPIAPTNSHRRPPEASEMKRLAFPSCSSFGRQSDASEDEAESGLDATIQAALHGVETAAAKAASRAVARKSSKRRRTWPGLRAAVEYCSCDDEFSGDELKATMAAAEPLLELQDLADGALLAAHGGRRQPRARAGPAWPLLTARTVENLCVCWDFLRMLGLGDTPAFHACPKAALLLACCRRPESPNRATW
ncbi:unnamed protein product [Phaeothamnion confervicola]